MITKNSNIFGDSLGYIIIISIPFSQLGFSYYASIHFIVFIYAFGISINSASIPKLVKGIVSLGILCFTIKAITLTFSSSNTRSILIPFRELICYVGFILISHKLSSTKINKRVVNIFVIMLLSSILILVIYQLYSLATGKYLGFPIEYFVMNQGTLEGVNLALEHKTRFRATAFYGEPSYTSWIVLSLLTIILSNSSIKEKISYFSIIISFIIVSLSQSIAGIIAITIISIYWFASIKKNKVKISYIIIGVLSILIILSATLLLSEDINSRLISILNQSDRSSNFRFSSPLVIIEKMLQNGELLGVSNYADMSIDNAALGLFVQYGILSLIILMSFIHASKNKFMVFYIILSLNFNGTIFRYDKVLIISLIVGISQGLGNTKVSSVKLRRDSDRLSTSVAN